MSGYLCKRCGETNPENFYKSNGAKTKCKKCHTMETHYKQRLLKHKAIAYLGRKCADCGLEHDSNSWLFDFHYINATDKEWSWGDKRTSNWNSMKKEIDKCVLLCSNCHRTRHHKEWLATLPAHHPQFDTVDEKGAGILCPEQLKNTEGSHNGIGADC